jgi:CRP-like cAMP-binding protein
LEPPSRQSLWLPHPRTTGEPRDAQTWRTYEPGQPIYYEATPAFAAFHVEEGLVKIWRMGHAGDQHVLGLRGPGDVLGYRAVIYAGPYAVTAEPLERTIAATIPREVFVGLVRDDPRLAFRLLEVMAQRTLETEDRLLARVLDSVIKRTARVLLALGREHGAPPGRATHLPRKREDLARLIGTTPETLSRTLHSLAARGILDLSNREIHVRDMDSLRRLAD